MTSLRNRTALGLTWTALGQFGGQAIQLVTAAVLARRLLPVDFGTAGLALAITTPLAALAQLGMAAALIQQPNLSRASYRTALITTVCASIVIGLVMLAGAGPAGHLFHNPFLPPTLRLYSLLVLLSAITAIQSAILGRFLDFRSQALAALGARLVGGITTVALAYANQGVMSIGWGYIALTLTNLALLHRPARHHLQLLPHPKPSGSFSPMLRYGSGIMAANILDQLSLGLDTMLVARLMGPNALGYYSFAAQLALYLGRSCAAVLNTVLFPALAKVNNTPRLRQAYQRLARAITWPSLAFAATIVILTPLVVPRLFGNNWSPAIRLIQLLTLYALFLFLLDSLTSSLLRATGRSNTLTLFSAVRVAGIALAVIVGSRLNLTGIALSLTLFAALYWLGAIAVVNRTLGLSFRDYFRALAFPIIRSPQPKAQTPDVCVLTTVHSSDDARIYHKEVRTLRSAGYSVAFLAPTHRTSASGLLRLASLLWRPASSLLPALRTKARVFHLHDPELLPVGLLLKALGKRVVYDIHEDHPQQIMDKHYLPRWLRPGISSALALLEQIGVRLFDGTVVATEALARRFPKERVTLVRNYPRLDTACATPACRQPHDPFCLIYLGGTLTEERGITNLIEALALLDDSFTLILGGRFVSRTYEKKVHSLPGFRRVRYLGTIPHQEVFRWYASAHAGIVPSLPLKRHQTALPVKMFEFMAARLPVIVPDFPLLRRIIDEWNCGICVNTSDSAAIAEAVRFLASCPETARLLGLNGHAAVMKRLNWSSEAANLLALYQHITSSPPSPLLKVEYPAPDVL